MTRSLESPVQVTAETHRFVFDGATTTFAIAGESTGGQLSVIHAVMPPGAGSVPHVHSREEETAYVLKGALRVETQGHVFDLHAGAAKLLPRGIPHRLSNATDQETQMLLICTPAGFEKLVQESAEFLLARGIDDGRPRQEDAAEFERIASAYGVTAVPEDRL
jgi:quercetin dioxygenase-like cupin family protein